jgi:hypothetical protein
MNIFYWIMIIFALSIIVTGAYLTLRSLALHKFKYGVRWPYKIHVEIPGDLGTEGIWVTPEELKRRQEVVKELSMEVEGENEELSTRSS